MGVADVADQLELGLGVAFVDQDASVQRADEQQRVLFQEDYADYGLVVALVVIARFHVLQELSSLAAVLADEAGSIAYEEFAAFVSEFGGGDVCVVGVFVEASEYFLECARDEVVDAYVCGGEEEEGVGGGCDAEVEDGVELVDFFAFLVEGGRAELCDAFFAD